MANVKFFYDIVCPYAYMSSRAIDTVSRRCVMGGAGGPVCFRELARVWFARLMGSEYFIADCCELLRSYVMMSRASGKQALLAIGVTETWIEDGEWSVGDWGVNDWRIKNSCFYCIWWYWKFLFRLCMMISQIPVSIVYDEEVVTREPALLVIDMAETEIEGGLLSGVVCRLNGCLYCWVGCTRAPMLRRARMGPRRMSWRTRKRKSNAEVRTETLDCNFYWSIDKCFAAPRCKLGITPAYIGCLDKYLSASDVMKETKKKKIQPRDVCGPLICWLILGNAKAEKKIQRRDLVVSLLINRYYAC